MSSGVSSCFYESIACAKINNVLIKSITCAIINHVQFKPINGTEHYILHFVEDFCHNEKEFAHHVQKH
jgi:hypothetical protein